MTLLYLVNDQKVYQTYTVINLEPNHSYYIKVRAENALGEGYVAKFPQIIMTLDSSMHKLIVTRYVVLTPVSVDDSANNTG